MCKKEVIQMGNNILREMTETHPKQIEICASILCPLVEATEKAVTFAEGCLQLLLRLVVI